MAIRIKSHRMDPHHTILRVAGRHDPVQIDPRQGEGEITLTFDRPEDLKVLNRMVERSYEEGDIAPELRAGFDPIFHEVKSKRGWSGPVQPTPKLLNILSYLATGWLPWGVQLPMHGVDFPHLSRIMASNGGPTRWILCCGHSLSVDEAKHLFDAGYVDLGPVDGFARETMVITDAGRAFLSQAWDMLEIGGKSDVGEVE